MTSRIIIDEDVRVMVNAINGSPTMSDESKLRHSICVLFLAYSGLRPETTARLTVGQFRKVLSQSPPVLKVEAKQVKSKIEHWSSLHPSLITSLTTLAEGKQEVT
jgi:hypothetical protein